VDILSNWAILPTGKVSHSVGKNYTIVIFVYNIIELFNEKMVFVENQPYICHQNVPINLPILLFSSKIVPNMVIFPVKLVSS